MEIKISLVPEEVKKETLPPHVKDFLKLLEKDHLILNTKALDPFLNEIPKEKRKEIEKEIQEIVSDYLGFFTTIIIYGLVGEMTFKGSRCLEIIEELLGKLAKELDEEVTKHLTPPEWRIAG